MSSGLIQEYLEAVRNIQASRYTCGAAMTVMLYDFLLTFSDEVRYVWSDSKKLSVVKIMFLWNRYFVIPWVVLSNYHLAGMRGPVSDNFCKFEIVAVAIIQGLSIIVGIQLLALRVLALYRNNRIVKYCLYAWLAACHITLYTIVIIAMKRFVPHLIYLPFTKTCYTIQDPIIGGVYIPPLLAEAAILLLQVLNHYQRKRRDTTFKTPLITALYRDGYLYFSAVMSVRLCCVFVYAFAPASLWFVSNQMDFPITAALISRFFIQLRGAVIEHDVTLTGPTTHSNPNYTNSKHQQLSITHQHSLSYSHEYSTNRPSTANRPKTAQSPTMISFGHTRRLSRNAYSPVEEPLPLKELRRMKVDRL